MEKKYTMKEMPRYSECWARNEFLYTFLFVIAVLDLPLHEWNFRTLPRPLDRILSRSNKMRQILAFVMTAMRMCCGEWDLVGSGRRFRFVLFVVCDWVDFGVTRNLLSKCQLDRLSLREEDWTERSLVRGSKLRSSSVFFFFLSPFLLRSCFFAFLPRQCIMVQRDRWWRVARERKEEEELLLLSRLRGTALYVQFVHK